MNTYKELKETLTKAGYILITHSDKSVDINNKQGTCLGRIGIDNADDIFVILQSSRLNGELNCNPLSSEIDEFWTDPDELTRQEKTKPQLIDVYASWSKVPSHMYTMYEERLKFTYARDKYIWLDTETDEELLLEEQKKEEEESRREREIEYNRANPIYDPSTGYNQNGFDRQGFDKHNYDQDGFHRITGYDREGFDEEGYNQSGRDRQGVDRKGYDSSGQQHWIYVNLF